jgi:hypothetical protein
MFVITGTTHSSSSGISSDSGEPDAENAPSSSSPPNPNPLAEAPARIRDSHRRLLSEPSTTTVTFTQEVTLRPTIEQNVAFAALQESRERDE